MSDQLSTRIGTPASPAPELDAYRLPDGRPLALFQLLRHCPPALADLRGATARALEATTMALRAREVLILRVLMAAEAEAEVQAHVALFAEQAMITERDLDRLRHPSPHGLEPDDQLMVEVADAMSAGGTIRDELWSQLVDRFEVTGAIEAIFIAAQYLKVAVMNNALKVVPPFPVIAGTRHAPGRPSARHGGFEER